METKIVQKFGNSGHIVLPKNYIGKRIKFIAETKTFNQIRLEVLNLITPHLENISGVYLYGSYARNEETMNSDIDLLITANKKINILQEGYKIISTTEEQIEKALEKDAILILPIIREAKSIINSGLIEEYKNYKLTQKNTKEFIEGCERILKIIKDSLEMDLGIGPIVYSLILRIRGLLILDLLLKNKNYTKKTLYACLGEKFTEKKVQGLYNLYTGMRDNCMVEDDTITKEDMQKLIKINEDLLKKIKGYKWEKRNT